MICCSVLCTSQCPVRAVSSAPLRSPRSGTAVGSGRHNATQCGCLCAVPGFQGVRFQRVGQTATLEPSRQSQLWAEMRARPVTP